MRVVATDVGYDNLKLRQVGEEFDMPEGSVGRWFQPVGAVEEVKDPAPVVVEAEQKAPAKRQYTRRA